MKAKENTWIIRVGEMQFTKWLMKNGVIGGATRLIIKAYHVQKESDPFVSDTEIFKAITKCRYNLVSNYIDPAIIGTIANPKTLREYLKCIIIYEGLPDSIDSAGTIEEVIDEICDEEEID